MNSVRRANQLPLGLGGQARQVANEMKERTRDLETQAYGTFDQDKVPDPPSHAHMHTHPHTMNSQRVRACFLTTQIAAEPADGEQFSRDE